MSAIKEITTYKNASEAILVENRAIHVFEDKELTGFTIEFMRPVKEDELEVPSTNFINKDGFRFTYISISTEAAEALMYLLCERLDIIKNKK